MGRNRLDCLGDLITHLTKTTAGARHFFVEPVCLLKAGCQRFWAKSQVVVELLVTHGLQGAGCNLGH